MTEEQLREWYEENGLIFGQKVYETSERFWMQVVPHGEKWGIKCNDPAYGRLRNLTITGTFADAEVVLTAMALVEGLTEVTPGT